MWWELGSSAAFTASDCSLAATWDQRPGQWAQLTRALKPWLYRRALFQAGVELVSMGSQPTLGKDKQGMPCLHSQAHMGCGVHCKCLKERTISLGCII